MRRIIFSYFGAICSVVAIVSCGSDGGADDGGGGTPPFVSESIEVSLTATADDFGSSTLAWREDDKLIIFYSKEGEITPTSTTMQSQSAGESTTFSGYIWSYEGAKSLYALYARNEQREWTIDSDFNVSITADMLGSYSSSFAPTGGSSAHDMGLLVGKVEGATCNDIETLNLTPVSSLFQLNLSGTVPDDTELSKVNLTAESGAPFITAGKLSLADGGVSASSYTDVVTSTVESGATGYFTIPLLPINVIQSITLSLTAIGTDEKEGWEWLYSYDLGSGVEFAKGVATSCDLAWSNFTTKIVKEVVSASSLSTYIEEGTTPVGDTWVIKTETEEVAEALTNLSTILSSDTVAEASVAVELPGVTELPADTFSGSGENSNSALASVTLSDVTTVGEAAFAYNTSVTEVVLGSTSDDGDEVEVTLAEGVFTDCTALTSCVVNTTALPKSTFKGCSALNTISLTKVTTIAESGCEGCSSLFTNSDTQSAPVIAISRASSYSVELVFTAIKSIGERAFFGCTQFDVIRLNESSDVVVTSIAEDAFSYDVNGYDVSYTPNITLYVSSAMKDYVDMTLNTLTVGGTTLTFKNILVDGVDDGIGATADDAEVEKI